MNSDLTRHQVYTVLLNAWDHIDDNTPVKNLEDWEALQLLRDRSRTFEYGYDQAQDLKPWRLGKQS